MRGIGRVSRPIASGDARMMIRSHRHPDNTRRHDCHDNLAQPQRANMSQQAGAARIPFVSTAPEFEGTRFKLPASPLEN